MTLDKLGKDTGRVLSHLDHTRTFPSFKVSSSLHCCLPRFLQLEGAFHSMK